ncbi:MAG TPA: YHYH protein [Gaiellaceae bacterium]|nr:YHYH protein [Gaiellaceae bacterium]
MRLLLAALVAASGIAPNALPLGDGHLSSTPARGTVLNCQSPPGGPGGGASGPTPWIHGSTWDSTAKPSVSGSVRWRQASYSTRVSGARRTITIGGVPTSFATGAFPIAPSDPAYAYDRNPNSIRPRRMTFVVPASPKKKASASCLPLGPIGVSTSGVAIYDALDAENRDAVAHEVLDACGGHPDQSGTYHLHRISPCVVAKAKGSATLVGYALDGFGIYVERDASGALLTNSALDACHGRTSVVPWNGRRVRIYHYDATLEYPYTLGCFRGATGTVH